MDTEQPSGLRAESSVAARQHIPEPLGEFRGGERLLEKACAALRQAVARDGFGGVPGHEDHGKAGLAHLDSETPAALSPGTAEAAAAGLGPALDVGARLRQMW